MWLVLTMFNEGMRENRDVTGQMGVFAVGQAVLKLGWFFQPNSSPEYGIDGEIEVVEAFRRSGKILKVQIKSGQSYFQEPTARRLHLSRGSRASTLLVGICCTGSDCAARSRDRTNLLGKCRQRQDIQHRVGMEN
jgi:hypothetical protein